MFFVLAQKDKKGAKKAEQNVRFHFILFVFFFSSQKDDCKSGNSEKHAYNRKGEIAEAV